MSEQSSVAGIIIGGIAFVEQTLKKVIHRTVDIVAEKLDGCNLERGRNLKCILNTL